MAGRSPIISDGRISGIPVNLGGKTQFGQLLKMGPGFYELSLVLNVALTVGTAAGPITEGILDLFSQIYIKTDLGEVVCDNVPAKSMFKVANAKAMCVPLKQEVAAASATYQVEIPIYFVDYHTVRPEDTILDTSRYSSVVFDLLTGTIANLFTAPGTGTIVVTADIKITRSKGRWNSVDAPIVGVINYSGRNPVDASVSTEIKLENANDLTLKRIYMNSVTSGVSGQPWKGTNSDAVISLINLKDSDGDWVKDTKWAQQQASNKRHYSLENNISGVVVLDFVRDGSLKSGIYTGSTGELSLNWTNNGVPAALSIVSVLVESYKTPRLLAA